MRKHAVLFTLTVLEIAGLLLTTFFWFVMRRDLLGTYRAGALPLAAEIALSTWFVPATSVAGALTVAAAFLPWWRTKTRTYLAGAGLVCTMFGLAFAIFAAYAPAFERLARVSMTASVLAADLDRHLRLFRPRNDPATTLRSPRRGGPAASRHKQEGPRGSGQSAFPSKVAPVRSV